MAVKSNKIFKFKIPGKLFLTGEWSVLKVNNPAIILPVNKFLEVKIKELDLKDTFFLSSKELNLKNKKNLNIPLQAIFITCKYLSENKIKIKSFDISISSQIIKGLGGSSAVTVGIITAILKLHKVKFNKKIIFKLGAISHYLAQNKIGSCADIACSTYQKTIIYKRFNPDWLKKNLNKLSLKNLVLKDWPNLEIKKINLPKNLLISIGYTKKPALTKNLIEKTQENKNYLKNLENINLVALEIIKSLRTKNFNQNYFLNLINKNRDLLKKLNTKLETPELTKLIETANKLGGAGKFSGAGGGDFGLAFSFDKKIAKKINLSWQKASIVSIDATS